MRTWLTAVLVLLVSAPVQAEVFKCVKNGKTSFQDRPCDAASSSAETVITQAGAGALPWAGLKHGMSVDDVRQRVSGVKPPASADSLNYGAKSLLAKTGVTTAGLRFDASYFFLDGAFVQVNATTPELSANATTLQNFEKLVAEFRRRYGKEADYSLKNEIWGVSGKADWSIGSDKLWISTIPVTAQASWLTYGYRLAPR